MFHYQFNICHLYWSVVHYLLSNIRARQAVRHTLVDVNAGAQLPDGLTRMKHGAAIEWCNSAIRELKHHPSRPGCLFRDIAGFLRPEFRELSGRDLMDRSLGHKNNLLHVPFSWAYSASNILND